ncbi:MAG TPA: septum site-determining protein MinC [Thiothrix sp.]|nr:septum site-determining protein MinC [Thiothrix sp.]
MLMVNILHLHHTNLHHIEQALQLKIAEASDFFMGTSLLVDCQALGAGCRQLNFQQLYALVQRVGLIPIGIRHIPEDCRALASKAGWAFFRATQRQLATNSNPSTNKQESQATASKGSKQALPEHTQEACVKVVDRPLRSGQQVFAPYSDVVVLHQTGAGSEILAGGSVHVYGALRGRVLAGVNGDTTARIFCQSLQAELLSIAGCYQLLDDADTKLKGQAAMIHLHDNKLVVESLS